MSPDYTFIVEGSHNENLGADGASKRGVVTVPVGISIGTDRRFGTIEFFWIKISDWHRILLMSGMGIYLHANAFPIESPKTQ
jgi:hypothetical protein